MTTEVRREMALDLCRNPAWPLFSDCADQIPQVLLAAYTITWHWSRGQMTGALSASTEKLGHGLVRAIQRLSYGMQIFVAHDAVQPRSAVTTYRRLWKSRSIPAPPREVDRGPEVEFDCPNGLRFAALATVPRDAIRWAFSVMDAGEIAIPVLLHTELSLVSDSARALAQASFTPDECSPGSLLSWPRLVQYVQRLGGITVRRVRDLARAEAGAVFFGAENDVQAFARAFEDSARLN